LVAHNNFIGQDDYENIVRLASEVKEKLVDALNKLDSINMSAEQKEEVAENIATTVNSTHAELISIWSSIQHLLIETAMTALDHEEGRGLIKSKATTRLIVNKLVEGSIVSADLAQNLLKLQLSRDIIVHNVDAELNESVLGAAEQVKAELIEILESFEEPFIDASPVPADEVQAS
jgi:uncharacterized protein YutE (UPF0331/DUF86 family)